MPKLFKNGINKHQPKFVCLFVCFFHFFNGESLYPQHDCQRQGMCKNLNLFMPCAISLDHSEKSS